MSQLSQDTARRIVAKLSAPLKAELERCAYCGRLPSSHGTERWDHKPILISLIAEQRTRNPKGTQ